MVGHVVTRSPTERKTHHAPTPHPRRATRHRRTHRPGHDRRDRRVPQMHHDHHLVDHHLDDVDLDHLDHLDHVDDATTATTTGHHLDHGATLDHLDHLDHDLDDVDDDGATDHYAEGAGATGHVVRAESGYWHGGRAIHGDRVLPPSVHGDARVCHGDPFVYIATTRSLALVYACTCDGWLYEVEPIGPVEQDPDSALDPGVSMRCAAARIVRRFKPSRRDVERCRAIMQYLNVTGVGV